MFFFYILTKILFHILTTFSIQFSLLNYFIQAIDGSDYNIVGLLFVLSAHLKAFKRFNNKKYTWYTYLNIIIILNKNKIIVENNALDKTEKEN